MLIRAISLLVIAASMCSGQIVMAPAVYSYPTGSGSNYAFVQQAEASLNTASTTEVEATIAPSTSGNLLIIVITYDRLTAPSFTIGDPTGSNTWASLGSAHDGSQYGMVAYYAWNCNAGSEVLRCTFGSAVAYPAIYVAEFSGLKTSATPLTGTPAFNVQNSPTTSTDATTSGNTTPGGQPALLFGFSQDILGTTPAPVAGTGFTSLASVWDYEGVIAVSARPEHKRITSTSAVAATFTAQVNERHISMVAAFLEP